MILKIIWSDFSEDKLDEIYEYHKNRASSRIAETLLKGIINAPNRLINAPNIGQTEESLKHRKIDYRYIVHKNYKLIYSVDNIKKSIKIVDVFDTRQNPIKINRNK